MTGQYKSYGSDINLALSPNAEVVVISTGSTLMFYNALNGKCDKVINDVYSGTKKYYFFLFLYLNYKLGVACRNLLK